MKQYLFSAWDKYESLTNVEKKRRKIYGYIITSITVALFIIICLLYPQIINPLRFIAFAIPFTIIYTIIWISWRSEWKKKRCYNGILKPLFNPTMNLITVRCPYCQTTFQIPQQNKTFRVKCPKCGGESKLG